MYDDNDDRDWLENFRSGRTWARGGFVLLFILALWFVRILVAVLAVLQFGATLITGRTVTLALPFGRSLSTYVREITLYVTYNSDRRPWPWSPWPDPGEGPESVESGVGGGGPESGFHPEPETERERPSTPRPAAEADEEPPAPIPETGETMEDSGPTEPDDSDADESEPSGNGADRSRRRKRKKDAAPGWEAPGSEPPRPDA